MNDFICLFLLAVAFVYLLIYLPFFWRSPQRDGSFPAMQRFEENKDVSNLLYRPQAHEPRFAYRRMW